MKTPREILFQKHQDAQSKLDVVRHQVVESTRRPLVLNWPILLWRELVWPSRRIWAGLAAVWVLLLAANVSLRDHSSAGTMASASPEMLLSFQQQERLLAELIGPNEPRATAPVRRNSSPPDRPKLSSPRSSSEWQLKILMT